MSTEIRILWLHLEHAKLEQSPILRSKIFGRFNMTFKYIDIIKIFFLNVSNKNHTFSIIIIYTLVISVFFENKVALDVVSCRGL